MKLRKKISIVIILMLICFTTSGCWDYMEIEHMALINAIGIDYNKDSNEITLTLQQDLPSQSKGDKGSSSSSASVHSATAKTIADALIKNQESIPQSLFYGYTQAIIIGEDAAKYITNDIIEFIVRTPSIRSSANLMIAPGKAEKILRNEDKSSQLSSGKGIYLSLFTLENRGYTSSVTINDFQQMLSISGIEPIASKVSLKSGQQGTDKSKNIVMSGLAVFKNDRLIGWLDDTESISLKIIKKKIRNTYMSVENDDSSSDNTNLHKMLYFNIINSSCNKKIIIDNNKPVIYLNIKIKASLIKYDSDKGSEFITPDIISKIEAKLSSKISKDVNGVINRSQKDFNSDIFGFGFQFHKQHSKEWHQTYEKEWDNIYSDIPVKVSVSAKVINTGSNVMKLFTK